MDSLLWMQYPRGKVILTSNIVQSVDLVTREQYEQQRQALEEEQKQRQERLSRERAYRLRKGPEVREEILTHPEYALQSPREKLETWKEFRTRFPETDIGEEYTVVLHAYEDALEETRRRNRVAELEDRLAQAERRLAERDRPSFFSNQEVRWYGYGSRYPVFFGRSTSCPPDPCRKKSTLKHPTDRSSRVHMGKTQSQKKHPLMTPVKMIPMGFSL